MFNPEPYVWVESSPSPPRTKIAWLRHRAPCRTGLHAIIIACKAPGDPLVPAAGIQAVPPSERINVACIGIRGRGNWLLRGFASEKDVSVTHLCDIDEKVLKARAAEMEKATGRAPRVSKDYRDFLEDKDLHVLVIGSPDHWHALQTINGCMAGKDVYVEKPDAHNIVEGKTMVEAARRFKTKCGKPPGRPRGPAGAPQPIIATSAAFRPIPRSPRLGGPAWDRRALRFPAPSSPPAGYDSIRRPFGNSYASARRPSFPAGGPPSRRRPHARRCLSSVSSWLDLVL